MHEIREYRVCDSYATNKRLKPKSYLSFRRENVGIEPKLLRVQTRMGKINILHCAHVNYVSTFRDNVCHPFFYCRNTIHGGERI